MIKKNDKTRREKIRDTMKKKFIDNPSQFDKIRKSSKERKQEFGYVNSSEARKKQSLASSRLWKDGRAMKLEGLKNIMEDKNG